ncbi:hypothetical protein VP01_170g1 [Puccinia sorghi]|uniref:Uncharacterized protein n=1 Tax=Puccinia sorghi TaxID=27349 RepID=A0A0L6VFG2_9BASI|nr:hypothetical protein VP01_170g1 [Puccinia sorghi]
MCEYFSPSKQSQTHLIKESFLAIENPTLLNHTSRGRTNRLTTDFVNDSTSKNKTEIGQLLKPNSSDQIINPKSTIAILTLHSFLLIKLTQPQFFSPAHKMQMSPLLLGKCPNQKPYFLEIHTVNTFLIRHYEVLIALCSSQVMWNILTCVYNKFLLHKYHMKDCNTGKKGRRMEEMHQSGTNKCLKTVKIWPAAQASPSSQFTKKERKKKKKKHRKNLYQRWSHCLWPLKPSQKTSQPKLEQPSLLLFPFLKKKDVLKMIFWYMAESTYPKEKEHFSFQVVTVIVHHNNDYFSSLLFHFVSHFVISWVGGVKVERRNGKVHNETEVSFYLEKKACFKKKKKNRQ